MDIEKIIAMIKEKTGLPDDLSEKAGEVISQNFGPGNEKKESIIDSLKEKVGLDDGKANDVYNVVAEFFTGNVLDKLKGFFGKE